MPRPHSTPPPAPEPGQDFEQVPCPLCGETETAGKVYDFAPYRVVKCAGCELFYTSPRLAEAKMLDAYREDSYFEGAEGPGYSSYRAQESTLRATFRKLLTDLEKRGIKGERLLEVGCAYGYFLDEAKGRYRHRVGTDFSEGAAAQARELAEAVYLGGLEQLPVDERYDLIACIHVIEHIYHPRPFVEQLVDKLAPGGWIVLACPDMGGFWRGLMGRRWPFFKLPEHVTYFTEATLSRLLEVSGLTEVQPLPYASYFSLDLIAEKLGKNAPAWLADKRLELPATTVCCAGRKAP